jgi:hypothetical protein
MALKYRLPPESKMISSMSVTVWVFLIALASLDAEMGGRDASLKTIRPFLRAL